MMPSWTRWEGRGSADPLRESSKRDKTTTSHRLLLLPSQPGARERVREYFRLSRQATWSLLGLSPAAVGRKQL